MIYVTIVSNKLDRLEEACKKLTKQTSDEFSIITAFNNDKDIIISCITNELTKIYDRKNKTLGDIRNLAIDYFLKISTKKDKLLWLDDDDSLSDNFIERVSYFDEYDFVSIEYYDRYKNNEFAYTIRNENISLQNVRDIKIFPFIWGKAFSNKLLRNKKVRCASTNNYEELPFFYNATKYSNKIISLSDILYEYQTNDKSVSNPKNIDLDKMFEDLLISLDQVNDKTYSKNMIKHEINYVLKHYDEYRIT